MYYESLLLIIKEMYKIDNSKRNEMVEFDVNLTKCTLS